VKRDDRCSGLWVWDAAGGAGGRAPCCVLGAGVGRRGCVGVVRNRMTGGQNISK